MVVVDVARRTVQEQPGNVSGGGRGGAIPSTSLSFYRPSHELLITFNVWNIEK